MQYRRVYIPGGKVFFTVVTYNRMRWFTDDATIMVLREAFRYVLKNHPFHIDAIVVLPDHIHTIWTLPEGDSDYPTRWRLLKSYFSHHFENDQRGPVSIARKRKEELAIWQRRYWEHQIRDEADYARHIEYIHYNPVKHGLVQSPANWPYSSFHTYVREGVYLSDWGAGELIWPELEADIE